MVVGSGRGDEVEDDVLDYVGHSNNQPNALEVSRLLSASTSSNLTIKS